MEYNPDKDKVSRVNASTPILEAGRVWVPDKPFAQELILEAATFPNAAYDDQVDAMVMAVLYLKESWRVDHPLDAYLIDDLEETKERRKRIGYWKF
jgi:phage terminase large subunit-like protein